MSAQDRASLADRVADAMLEAGRLAKGGGRLECVLLIVDFETGHLLTFSTSPDAELQRLALNAAAARAAADRSRS